MFPIFSFYSSLNKWIILRRLENFYIILWTIEGEYDKKPKLVTFSNSKQESSNSVWKFRSRDVNIHIRNNNWKLCKDWNFQNNALIWDFNFTTLLIIIVHHVYFYNPDKKCFEIWSTLMFATLRVIIATWPRIVLLIPGQCRQSRVCRSFGLQSAYNFDVFLLM